MKQTTSAPGHWRRHQHLAKLEKKSAHHVANRRRVMNNSGDGMLACWAIEAAPMPINRHRSLGEMVAQHPHWRFPQHWGKRGLSINFRFIFQPKDDSQIPHLGCVCCKPSSRSVHVGKRRTRKAQLAVRGMEVAEFVIGWLNIRITTRAWSIQKPPPSEIIKRLAMGITLIPNEYPPYLFFPPYILDGVGPFLDDAFMSLVPVQVRVSRQTEYTSPLTVTGAVWEDDFVRNGSYPLPSDVPRTGHVIRANDLKRGLTLLLEWLVFGAQLSDANKALAEVAANWLFPRTYNGARTGRTKVERISRKLHHPCEEHRSIIANLFGWPHLNS